MAKASAGLLLAGTIAAFFVPAPVSAEGVQNAQAGSDCTCRYRGKNVQLGQTVCIRTSSGTQLARCEMALNNPSWKLLGGSCPLASNMSSRPTGS